MSNPKLTRGSGQILAIPSLALVFWGKFWADNPSFVSAGTIFFTQFLHGQNMSRLAQYGIGAGQISSVSVVTQPWLGSIDIANSLGEAIQSKWIPPPASNTLYVFLQDPTQPGATGSGGLGAQHWLSTNVASYTYGTPFWFLYSLMSQPMVAALSQPGMTGYKWWSSQASIYTALLSHEMYEAFTDPTAFTAWADANYPTTGYTSECCDICDHLLNSGDIYQQLYGQWSIDCYWSNSDNACFLGFENNWINLGTPVGGNSSYLAAARSQNGSWVLFAATPQGDLWSYTGSSAGKPSGSWSGGTWSTLASTSALSGPIAAVMNATTDLLEVFGINQSGQLWHIYETQPNGSWSSGEVLGSPSGIHLITNVTIGYNSPNVAENEYQNLEAFAVGSDNQLHHIWQLGAWKGWSGWSDSLGAPPPGLGAFSNPCVGSNADGRLEVFVLGADASIWHIWQVAPNSGWSIWQSLPLNSTDGASIQMSPRSWWQVGRNNDGRLELFLVAANSSGAWNVYHTYQVSPNGNWSQWNALMPLNVPQAVKFQGFPAVVNNSSEYQELNVCALGSDGGLWNINQANPLGTGWNPWQFLSSPANVSLNLQNSPSIAVTQNGLTILTTGTDGNIWSISQTQPSGPWGSILLP